MSKTSSAYVENLIFWTETIELSGLIKSQLRIFQLIEKTRHGCETARIVTQNSPHYPCQNLSTLNRGPWHLKVTSKNLIFQAMTHRHGCRDNLEHRKEELPRRQSVYFPLLEWRQPQPLPRSHGRGAAVATPVEPLAASPEAAATGVHMTGVV